MVTFKELNQKDLPKIAEIHCSAFPNSALTRLGQDTIIRYYAWQFEGPHKLLALGILEKERLIGFLFGGCFRGALGGFLRHNIIYLLLKVLSKPWLLLDRTVCSRIFLVIKIMVKKIIQSYVNNRKIIKTDDSFEPQIYLPSFGILSIAIDPEYQGKGYGTVLINETLKRARDLGYRSFHLTVHPDNINAIRFYERHGLLRVIQNGEWKGLMVKNFKNDE